MPSMVQIAVGAAMTSFSDPADEEAGLDVWVGVTEVADVIVGSAPFPNHNPSPAAGSLSRLPSCIQVHRVPGRGRCAPRRQSLLRSCLAAHSARRAALRGRLHSFPRRPPAYVLPAPGSPST